MSYWGLSDSQRYPSWYVHPDSGRTWSAGLWMGSLSVPCILRSGPLESCSLVICRLVVWPLLWLSLLFAVVISECLPYFPIYSLIPVASVVFIIHLFVFFCIPGCSLMRTSQYKLFPASKDWVFPEAVSSFPKHLYPTPFSIFCWVALPKRAYPVRA